MKASSFDLVRVLGQAKIEDGRALRRKWQSQVCTSFSTLFSLLQEILGLLQKQNKHKSMATGLNCRTPLPFLRISPQILIGDAIRKYSSVPICGLLSGGDGGVSPVLTWSG